MSRTSADERQADVIVVGAGPAGSTAAFHLAQAGVDVLLLEKTSFPREKVCGDGLTPRAVKQLIGLGIDIDAPGWIKNKGLRIVGGGHQIELPWPDLAEFPPYGLVRTRMDFDEILVRHAEKAGARLMERTAVTGPVVDEQTGRVVGVTTKPVDDRGRRLGGPGEETTYRAPIVISADGVSDDDWLESWLELWDGKPGKSNLLPGYGWIFGVGDGTANVGLGVLNTSKAFQQVDYKDLLRRWLENTPEEWGFREENMVGKISGAALPMGFNRKPHYTRGVLLVGDSGGMVNPMNGEGIAYAMESGEMAAATVVQALGRSAVGHEKALQAYPAALDAAYGGYYTLGRVFVKLIGNPHVMKQATKYGLPRPTLMKFTLKMLANLTDPRSGDVADRVINAMSKVAPRA